MFSLSEQIFTFGQAAKAAGITEKQLRNWLARDLINLPAESDRTETNWRRFALIDIFQIAVVARLAQYGVQIPEADEIYRKVVGGRVRVFGRFKRAPEDALTALLQPIEIYVAHDLADGKLRYWQSTNQARIAHPEALFDGGADVAIVSMNALMKAVIEKLVALVAPDAKANA